jgi:hypothetical protein
MPVKSAPDLLETLGRKAPETLKKASNRAARGAHLLAEGQIPPGSGARR